MENQAAENSLHQSTEQNSNEGHSQFQEGRQPLSEKSVQESQLKKKLKKKRFLSSRTSVSSVDSLDLVRMNNSPSTRQRWTTLDTAGRSLLVLSTALLLAGIIITIFGFTDLSISSTRQLPMQIIGPACLMATAVMWVVGGVFCRLWAIEMRRQKHSMELRTRVQLHALAMDMLKKPQIYSSQALEDPRIRRQLLLKLRQQNALDTSSLESTSRRSSRVASLDTKTRHSHSGSLIGSFFPGFGSGPSGNIDRRRSTETSIGGGSIILPAQFDLPGIHISRIETLDFDDMSMLSGFGQLGPRRYIIIESDGSSEYSKMSIPNSECSFSICSRSSKSRSSRDSSNFGSHVWDFSSPRESDWDVNTSYNVKGDSYNCFINPRHASMSSATPSFANVGSSSLLSPSMPRKGSTVTFDTNDHTTRRHSSPASSFRRKDGRTNISTSTPPTVENHSISTTNKGLKHKDSFSAINNGKNDSSAAVWLFANQPSFYGGPTFRKKSAGDQSLISIVIDENDGDEEEGSDIAVKTDREETSAVSKQKNSKAKTTVVKPLDVSSKISTIKEPGYANKRRSSFWHFAHSSFENSDDQKSEKFSILSQPVELVEKGTASNASNTSLSFGRRKSSVISSKLKFGITQSTDKHFLWKTSPKKESLCEQENDKYDSECANIETIKKTEVARRTSKFSTFASSIISNLYHQSIDGEEIYSQTKAQNCISNVSSIKQTTSEKSKFRSLLPNFVK